MTSAAVATKSPVPTYTIADETALLRLRYWVREFEFTSCHTAENATGTPAVALLRDGAIIAGVLCTNPWLQRNVANICEAVLLQRDAAAAIVAEEIAKCHPAK